MQSDLEHLGEAAGVAAAMASRLDVPLREIPIKGLQKELVGLGVLRQGDIAGLEVENAPSLDVLHRQDYWREERERQFPATGGQTLSVEGSGWAAWDFGGTRRDGAALPGGR